MPSVRISSRRTSATPEYLPGGAATRREVRGNEEGQQQQGNLSEIVI